MKEHIPLNHEKEKLFNSKIEKLLCRKRTNNISIIERNTNLEEVHDTQVSILINKYNKRIGNSIVQSDIIQNALEYNNHLITELERNKDKISNAEYNNGIVLLWENLKKLAKNSDDFTSRYNLNDNRKYVEMFSWYKERYIPTGLTVVIDKSILVKEEQDIKEEKFEENGIEEIIEVVGNVVECKPEPESVKAEDMIENNES
jgi:hypothetical protein